MHYSSLTFRRQQEREKLPLQRSLFSAAMTSSSEPFLGQDRRVVPNRAASNMLAALPVDAQYDILLRCDAKELCGLRLVCRSWRSLLSDPDFAAAYAARHPGPLIIVGNNENPSEDGDWNWAKPRKYESVISIMDLSGNILKQVRSDGHITSMSLNLACVKKIGDGSGRLVNPVTGAVHYVPKMDPAYGYSDKLCLFGKVASMREYKMLRKVSYSLNGNYFVIFEICNICRSGIPTEWRVIQDPPHCIDWCEKASVVIDGVVYFLTKSAYSAAVSGSRGIEQDWIASFDLETERWKPNIRGPQSLVSRNRGLVQNELSLVNLNGSLVIVHLPSPCMDIWYLLDSEKGLWVKQYSIQIEEYNCSLLSFCPLIVLDDGRIVIHIEGSEKLEIYDPRTNKLSRVAEAVESCAVSVYTGTLLSLEW